MNKVCCGDNKAITFVPDHYIISSFIPHPSSLADFELFQLLTIILHDFRLEHFR